MVEEMLFQTEDTVFRIAFTTLETALLIAFHTLEITELMVFIMLEMKLEIAFQTDVTTYWKLCPISCAMVEPTGWQVLGFTHNAPIVLS